MHVILPFKSVRYSFKMKSRWRLNKPEYKGLWVQCNAGVGSCSWLSCVTDERKSRWWIPTEFDEEWKNRSKKVSNTIVNEWQRVSVRIDKKKTRDFNCRCEGWNKAFGRGQVSNNIQSNLIHPHPRIGDPVSNFCWVQGLVLVLGGRQSRAIHHPSIHHLLLLEAWL